MVTITSLYKQLFGRQGPDRGSVIDMAEHGRVGGNSAKQGFKYTDSIKQQINVQTDSGDALVKYVGFAAAGVTTSAASWQIMKVDKNTGTIIQLADGDDNFDNIFDDRESLDYS